MGGQTPIFGIRFPFQHEVENATHFQNFADDVDAALDLVEAAQVAARERMYVSLSRAAGTAIATATETDVAWTTLNDASDSGIWAGGAPTNIVLPTPGLYAVSVGHDTFSSVTDVDALSIRVRVNGDYRLGRRSQMDDATATKRGGLSGVAYCATAGHVLIVSFKWNGSGGPPTIPAMRVQVSQLVDLT